MATKIFLGVRLVGKAKEDWLKNNFPYSNPKAMNGAQLATPSIEYHKVNKADVMNPDRFVTFNNLIAKLNEFGTAKLDQYDYAGGDIEGLMEVKDFDYNAGDKFADDPSNYDCCYKFYVKSSD